MKDRAILYTVSQGSVTSLSEHTLIVNVARSCEIGVALALRGGITRPVLPSTVAMDRACCARRICRPAALKPAGLMNRANML